MHRTCCWPAEPRPMCVYFCVTPLPPLELPLHHSMRHLLLVSSGLLVEVPGGGATASAPCGLKTATHQLSCNPRVGVSTVQPPKLAPLVLLTTQQVGRLCVCVCHAATPLQKQFETNVTYCSVPRWCFVCDGLRWCIVMYRQVCAAVRRPRQDPG